MTTPQVACRYEMWDGSYVLGSLSPAERREYESHLDSCESCSRAVRDLAGLPGLLGRIGPEIFDEPALEPVPETLLPRLSRAVRRSQQRRTWLTSGVAAAAAVVITSAGALALGGGSGTPEAGPPTSGPTAIQAVSRPMTKVSHDPMVASVAVQSVGWGTKLTLSCSYPVGGSIYEGGAYALVVHTKDGKTQKIATWNGLPGKSMSVDGATSTAKQDIRSVEVTTSTGTPVAELSL